MNTQATKHLSQAASFVAKGTEFYRKAAEEIVAAQKADSTLSNRQAGEYIGEIARGESYSENWVRGIVRWRTSSQEPADTPWAFDTPRRQADMTKQILREAPLEQIEQIIDQLPADRRVEIAEAALKPEKNERQRGRKTRQANREERHEDPARYAAQVVSLDLRKANDALLAAVSDAQDTNWPQEWSDRLLAKVAVTAELLDMLRMTLTNSDAVDWDRELARLTEAADAAGKEF